MLSQGGIEGTPPRTGLRDNHDLGTVSILKCLVSGHTTAVRQEAHAPAGQWIGLPRHPFLGVESCQIRP